MNVRFVMFALLIFLTGLAVGYGLGYADATELFISKGINFLQSEGVNVTISEDWVLGKIQKWTGS